MKIIEEFDKEVETSDSLSEYLMSIKKAINDEAATIALYDKILGSSKTPTASKEIIQEIIDDEKDHLVILSALFQDIVETDFPEYGDEEVQNGMEIQELDGKDKEDKK